MAWSMKLSFLKVMTFINVSLILVSSEQPFCNNRCNDTGISTSKICYCDSVCAVFNDCCGDSEYLLNKYGQPLSKQDKKITCKTIADSNVSAFVIDKCPLNWKGPEAIEEFCVQVGSSMDPISEVPVTNPLTGTTYKNYHCAICNRGMETLVFWKIKIICPTMSPNMMDLDTQEVLKYIFYNESVGRWGFSVVNSIPYRHSFHGCRVTYTIPRTLKSKVRQCDPGLVSACSSMWKEDFIKLMCSSYIDPIYSKDGVARYRNLYCAICNKVDLSQLSCGKAMGPRLHQDIPRPDDLAGNFALLLDVDTRDGDIVGRKITGTTCGKEEIFDPFGKKCRNIVCGIPGYTLVDNKCVQSFREL